MPAPVYLATDFLAAFQALLPSGRAWPRDPDAMQTSVLAGLMPTYERSNARANYLLADAFPPTADELLPEWEASLGLPDPCVGPEPTIQLRQATVLARFVGLGGQSVAHYMALAAALGFTITISQYTPFRCGQQRCGDPLGSPDWAFTWAVNAPSETVTIFAVGRSAVGEPLQSWGNAVLECELAAAAPAHTVLQFHYS